MLSNLDQADRSMKREDEGTERMRASILRPTWKMLLSIQRMTVISGLSATKCSGLRLTTG